MQKREFYFTVTDPTEAVESSAPVIATESFTLVFTLILLFLIFESSILTDPTLAVDPSPNVTAAERLTFESRLISESLIFDSDKAAVEASANELPRTSNANFFMFPPYSFC